MSSVYDKIDGMFGDLYAAPDRYDDLPAGIAWAVDCAKDPTCPIEYRYQLIRWVDEAVPLLERIRNGLAG